MRTAALVGALLGVLVVTQNTGAAGNRTVLHYGDSLAVGTDLFLERFLRGWTVQSSTALNLHAHDVPDAVRSLGRSLPRVLVVSAGTNDDPGAVSEFRALVRRTLSLVGQGRCVVWATVVRPPYRGVSYEGYNDALRAAARRLPNLLVLDWAAMAKAHPGWFGADGVHPSMDGYRARAKATARLIERC